MDDVKVGDLATATGLTVRTLHYYDEIGLLRPSRRSGGGHRLYSADDVQRLYRIALLRQIGLSLEEISRALDDPQWDLATAMDTHIGQLDERLAVGHRLRRRLTGMVRAIADDGQPSTSDLLETLEEMTMLETKVQRRIPTLVYADIERAHNFLVDVFGMEAGRMERDDSGTVVHAELTAGDGVIWLHRVAPEFGLVSPQDLHADTAGMSIVVDDVDAHFRHAEQAGADIRYQPLDQPYGFREYSAYDCERRLWSFLTPLD